MTPRVEMLVLGLLSSGCGCPPLDEAPVDGDPPAVALYVAEVVRTFSTSTSLQVCVPAVHVRDVSKGDGRYNPVSRGIRIDPTAEDLEVATLHELCHAADLQHDLSNDLAEELNADHRRERRERWAEACSEGPLAAWVAADECPGDRGDSGTWRAIRDRLYDIPPGELGQPLADYDVLGQIALPELSGGWLEDCTWTSSDDSLLFFVNHPTDPHFVRLDAHTGSPITPVLPVDFPPLDPIPDLPGPWRLIRSSSAGDQAVAIATLGGELFDVQRVLVHADDQWHVHARCPTSNQCTFVRDGELWSAELVGEVLSWARIRD